MGGVPGIGGVPGRGGPVEGKGEALTLTRLALGVPPGRGGPPAPGTDLGVPPGIGGPPPEARLREGDPAGGDLMAAKAAPPGKGGPLGGVETFLTAGPDTGDAAPGAFTGVLTVTGVLAGDTATTGLAAPGTGTAS